MLLMNILFLLRCYRFYHHYTYFGRKFLFNLKDRFVRKGKFYRSWGF
jgi:hypothetical protein